MYFVVETLADGTYMVKPSQETVEIFAPVTIAFTVIEARIFGISYVEYLRMCRDVYGANILGKNCLYYKVSFDKKEAANKLAKELNSRFTIILAKR